MEKEDHGYNNFLELKNKIILPKGTNIVNDSGLWLIQDDFQEILYYTSTTEQPIAYQIHDLELKQSIDEIYTIDFIEKNRLYIYASKENVPTGFLADVKESTNKMPDYFEVTTEKKPEKINLTNVLSFALDSFYFHRQILVSYTPLRGAFVIISKEGITLLDTNFKSYLSLIHPLNFFLHSKNYLYVADEMDAFVYRFDLLITDSENINSTYDFGVDTNEKETANIQLEDSNFNSPAQIQYNSFYSTTKIWESTASVGSYPCAFIALSFALVIIAKNSEKKSFTVQIIWLDSDKESISYDMESDIHPNIKTFNYSIFDSSIKKRVINDSNDTTNMCFETMNESEWYVQYFSFIPYDDCLISVDCSTDGFSSFIDFAEESQYTCIVRNFQLPSNMKLKNTFCDDIALCSSGDTNIICTLYPKYSEVASDSLHVIASLMRRKHGLNASLDKIRKIVNHTTSISDLNEIINIIGPAAAEPSAQIRFARLTQFSGIQNPHLIALALLKFIKILGDKLIDETMVPVIESLSHPIIKPLIDSIIRNGMLRLDERTIYCLTSEFEKRVYINESNVDDMLQYANALIDSKMWKYAKIAIIKAKLSNQYTEEQLREIENRLNENCQK